MFADLGLAEDEIARHLQIDRAMVRRLHHNADMDGRVSVRQNPAEGHCALCPCLWLGVLQQQFRRR
jgi:DNA-binding transcriptional regulator LsrR (DeoR family)